MNNSLCIIDNINWDSSKNLIITDTDNKSVQLVPTIIQDTRKNIIGLAYSSKQSLELACERKIGIYHSRNRGLWVKSPTMINGQKLVSIEIDCDHDALLFTIDQREGFCHINNNHSCFNANSNLKIKLRDEQITIGYCTGCSEKITFDLLSSIGIKVYRNYDTRKSEFIIKSHLHSNIKLVGVKPKDVTTILKNAHVDIMIAYDNLLNEEISYQKITKSTGVHPVKIVAVSLKEKTDLVIPLKIITEYPDLTKKWLEKSGNYDKSIIVQSYGNTEAYIKNGYGDVGIVVCDSGATIESNNLKIIDVLSVNDLYFFFNEKFYEQFPRFVRELRLALSNDTIYFYSVDTVYGFMSNFYPCEFIDSKKNTWKSSEHYYQAHKFADINLFHKIKSQPTPKLCYKTAWKYKNLFRKDWTEIKDGIMWKAINYKFDQNPDLKQKLIDTYPKTLVEHALKDFHYGCGIDGSGKNILGKMLMELRNNYVKYTTAKL